MMRLVQFELLDCGDIFGRASAIAKRRYPKGCSSGALLGDIVREAIDELRREKRLTAPGQKYGG